jgi:hypothetical protein
VDKCLDNLYAVAYITDMESTTEGATKMTKPTILKVRQMTARTEQLPISGVQARWVERPRLVTYPTGMRGYRAKAEVSAAGYRTTVRLVTADSHGINIR